MAKRAGEGREVRRRVILSAEEREGSPATFGGSFAVFAAQDDTRSAIVITLFALLFLACAQTASRDDWQR
jgi:hypothetical protein